MSTTRNQQQPQSQVDNSNDSTDGAAAAALRRTLQALNVQRQSLEMESAALVSELTAVNPANPTAPPMGIDAPLVDAEGYPRNDIDIHRARTLRQRLAQIRTDHRQLMRQIEAHLHQLSLQQNADKAAQEQEETEARQQAKPKPKYDPVTKKWVVRNWDGTIAGAGPGEANKGRSFDHLTATSQGATGTASTTTGVANMSISDSNTNEETVVHRAAAENSNGSPFCRVDSVAPSSPAASAGLQVDDEILAFGPCTELSEVAELVRTVAAENSTIELRIRRPSNRNNNSQGEVLLLRLAPRPWNGRGLLGCHIVPV